MIQFRTTEEARAWVLFVAGASRSEHSVSHAATLADAMLVAYRERMTELDQKEEAKHAIPPPTAVPRPPRLGRR